MQFTSYINFNGQCEAAFQLYERVFGGKITMLVPYSTTPMADGFAGLEHENVPRDFDAGTQRDHGQRRDAGSLRGAEGGFDFVCAEGRGGGGARF